MTQAAFLLFVFLKQFYIKSSGSVGIADLCMAFCVIFLIQYRQLKVCKNIRKYQRQRLGINQISFSQISDFKTAIRIHKEDQHSSVNSRHHPHTSAVKRIQNDLIIITNPKLMICYCKKQDHNH
jgi:hypothetical protein